MDYPRYDPQSPVTPLTDAEFARLDALLQALPVDGAMTLDGVDGFFTALLVGPGNPLGVLDTAEWLPLVWGGDGPGGHDEAAPFASKRQRKATVVELLRHLRHVSAQLSTAPDDWEPVFSVAEQGALELADARDWCAGFLQAVDLRPDSWLAAWADPVLGPALAPVLLLGGGVDGVAPMAPGDGTPIDVDLDDLAVVDALSRAAPDGVLLLLAQLPTSADGSQDSDRPNGNSNSNGNGNDNESDAGHSSAGAAPA